ncbi:MAG: serine O-acetyltransferase, partial [Pseudomonadota bacterium]|nr:serine O-acetyltransferase [Pseudomonadota bacterium]
MTALTTPIDFWSTLKQEAQVVAEKEPLLSSYVHASVLAHHNFESSLSFILSNKMADDVMPALAIREVFDEAYLLEPGISEAAIADILAIKARDAAVNDYLTPLLHFKG